MASVDEPFGSSKIARSPHAQEIHDAIRLGWASIRVANWAKRQFGEDHNPRSIRFYRQKLVERDPEAVLPTPMVQAALKGIAAKVDVVQDQLDIVAIQQSRVARALKFEEGLGIPRTESCGPRRQLRIRCR